MATLLDDDFQSYTIGAGPPYSGGLLNAYSAPPTIGNSVTGIFGDAKSLVVPSGQSLLFPCPFLSLSNTLPTYSQFTVFLGVYIFANSSGSAGGLLAFNSNLSPFAGIQVAAIQIYSDGTIGIANTVGGVIPFAISDLAFKQGGWYIVRADIVFSTSGSQVAIDCQVYVNGALWVTYSGPVAATVASLPGVYVNNVIFGGGGGGNFQGRYALYDTVQAADFWPHPGTPEARVTQGVIELILSETTADIEITCPPATTGTVGVAYSSSFGVTDLTGTPPYTFALTSGSFPTGLTLDTTTGLLSGTPTTAGVFSFEVTVTDIQGNTSDPASCSITIAIAITCPPAATANIFEPYSSNSGISGQTDPVTWSISSGALPTGLAINASTGNISGSPTVLGVFNFTLHVVDDDGNVGSKPCTITIIAVRPARYCTTI